MTVAYDLLGAQSPDYRDRGVARYVLSVARALEAIAPDAVDFYVVDGELTLPSGIESLVATGKVVVRDEVDWASLELFHVASPIELSVPVGRLVPETDAALVVTLYDLIPERFADVYGQDPGQRRRYRARLELVRRADRVLAISEAVAVDGREYLALSPDRLSVVGAGVEAQFRLPDPPGDKSPSVLYTGGTDPRKNVEALLEAWGRLPVAVRSSHQLVIACSVGPLQQNHWEHMARERGFADGLRVTGHVAEDELVRLYQSASLYICPSLWEGSWLPVAEAQSCGTPAIGSDRSALVERVPEGARFDPTDPGSMAAAIESALTGGPVASAAASGLSLPRPTWEDVATKTAAAYASVLRSGGNRSRKPGPIASRTKRMALVTPWPPVPTGVARYSARLAAELGKLGPVDVYVDGAPHERQAIVAAEPVDGVGAVRPLGAFERMEALAGRYDGVVYAIGNSEHHTGALAALKRRPGVVLAHDVRLANLYRFARWQHPAAVPDGFDFDLLEEEPEALLARDVIAASTSFATTSAFAARLARLDAWPDDRHKVIPLSFAVGPSRHQPEPRPAGRRVIASFGVVHPTKQPDLLLEAIVKVPDTELAFVGPGSTADLERLRQRAAALGVAGRLTITGRLDDRAYDDWLARTTIAVQLRSTTNGEASAATGDCLANGLATVVTDIGSARELPDSAVRKVPVDVTAGRLGDTLARLLDDEQDRSALEAGARDYADAHTFARAAAELYELVSRVDSKDSTASSMA